MNIERDPGSRRSKRIQLATLGTLTLAVAACGLSHGTTAGNASPAVKSAASSAVNAGSVPSSVTTTPATAPASIAASGGTCPSASVIAKAIGVSPEDLGSATPGANADGTELCTYVGLGDGVQVFYGPPSVNSYFTQSCQTNNARSAGSCAWAQAGQRSYLVNGLGLSVPAQTVLNAILHTSG